MIDFSDYRRLRRLGLSKRSAFRNAARNESRFGDSVVGGLAAFVLLWVAVSAVDNYVEQRESDAKNDAEKRVEHLEKVVIQCLSHAAVSINGRAWMCEMSDMKIDL